MKRKTKLVTTASTMLAGLALSFGVVSGISKNLPKEAEALYTPSQTYNVSDTAEELTAYYSSIGSGDTGTTLLGKLRSLNSSKYHKNFSYSNFGTSATTSPYVYTDYPLGTTTTDSNGQVRGSAIASFYTKTTSTGYNKEHVWPDSKGGNKVENDILMPRPSIPAENSSRGNSFYVENMNSNGGGWDPYKAGYEIACRGECARIILYCMVANSSLNLVASNTGGDNTMGNMNTLIKWHFDYSPSTYEMNRNNGAEYLQGNRNPFVDHPEYVAKIWSNFNSTVSSICENKSAMYAEWVPGSCSNYGTNDAAGIPDTGSGEGGESGEQGGGEQGGGVVGDVVTSNSQLSNGDKVIIHTQEPTPKGLTGYNGTKDATISTSESDWKEYTVESASSSGFKLKDGDEYIASPGGNEFKYNSTGGNCYVDNDGRLMCSNRYLCVNGINYRFYTSYGSYPTFYVYLKSSSSGGQGGGETPEVTSISASTSKTYYVGETISSSDISVKNNLNETVLDFTFANDGYKFTYEDAASGGVLTNKTFTNSITAGSLTCPLSVQVQRKNRIDSSAAIFSVSSSDLPTAYSTAKEEITAESGIKFIAYNLAHYNSSGKMQFRSTSGYLETTKPLNLLSLTINTPEQALKVYGSNTTTFTNVITGINNVYNLSGYSYLKVAREESGVAYCASLTISVGGSDSAINLANYIMYEDTNNQCVEKLPTAMSYLKELSSTEKSTFEVSSEYVIKTARERLEAWALNQGKTINYATGVLVNKSNSSFYGIENDTSTLAIIITITSMSTISLSVLLIIKKKRLHN